MRNNWCNSTNEYVQHGLVDLEKNQKNLSEETNQKVEAVAKAEKD